MIKIFTDWLLNGASPHTILWVEGMYKQFPRQKPTDVRKTEYEHDKIIYRT